MVRLSFASFHFRPKLDRVSYLYRYFQLLKESPASIKSRFMWLIISVPSSLCDRSDWLIFLFYYSLDHLSTFNLTTTSEWAHLFTYRFSNFDEFAFLLLT